MTYAITMYARGLPNVRVACIRNGSMGRYALLSGYLKIKLNTWNPQALIVL